MFCFSCLECGHAFKDLQPVHAGGSARVAKVLAFASLGLQIHFLCILLIMSCNVLLVCHELCKPHIILILYNLLVFDVHKEHTNSLDLKDVANDFVSGSDHHIHVFSTFCRTCHHVANIKITAELY